MIAMAMTEVRKKKNPIALSEVSFETFVKEPPCKPCTLAPREEGPTIERLHRFIADSGHQLADKHHEIYLSDIRKADPKKWKTIIRQPIQ